MRFLLRPGWLAFIALVVGFAVACYTLLAPWQFGREDQREAQERAIVGELRSPDREQVLNKMQELVAREPAPPGEAD